MPDMVVDELTGDRVIFAPGRARRPDTFRVDETPAPRNVANCPFCPGNEHETPPEVARIGPGLPDGPDWRVRVVPNLYPIVGDGVAGAHEVVILSPAHDCDLAGIGADRARDVLLALRDRARFHLDQGLVHAQPFVNHGKGAGASIEHPHAQLVVIDHVPPRVGSRLQRFADAGRNLVRAEMKQAAQIFAGDVPAWCPPGATKSFLCRLALVEGGARFDDATDDEIAAVAAALQDLLARMHRLLGGVPYNVVVESAPRAHDGQFQWWIDVVPRLTVVAGFELGTGLWVNVMPATDAAEALASA
jgi:UDPglucose--hexose-1-phosphate uridylyltransferase